MCWPYIFRLLWQFFTGWRQSFVYFSKHKSGSQDLITSRHWPNGVWVFKAEDPVRWHFLRMCCLPGT
jgi:hypothetical protein